jgi:ligand-binding sensor domain-containing protein
MRTNKKIIIILFLGVILSAFSQSKWTTYRISNSFSPKNDISAIRFDKNENMWVATWNGLYKLVDNKWQTVGPENIYIQSFYIDNQDVKWVGILGARLYMSEDGMLWNPVKEVSLASSINAITADKTGTIWVGDWLQGVFSYKNKTWTNYKSDQLKLGDNSVTSISCDSKNNMWFGSYHGLTGYNPLSGSKIYNTENSKLPVNDVYSLYSDSKDNLWIGTINGLAEFNGKDWSIFKRETSDIPSGLIFCITEDQRGYIWIGTDKGVSFFNGKIWTTFNVENSQLIDNRVQTITAHNSKVFIGTSKGISVVELP